MFNVFFIINEMTAIPLLCLLHIFVLTYVSFSHSSVLLNNQIMQEVFYTSSFPFSDIRTQISHLLEHVSSCSEFLCHPLLNSVWLHPPSCQGKLCQNEWSLCISVIHMLAHLLPCCLSWYVIPATFTINCDISFWEAEHEPQYCWQLLASYYGLNLL